MIKIYSFNLCCLKKKGRGGGAYFKLWITLRHLFEGGAYLRGGGTSIYGTLDSSHTVHQTYIQYHFNFVYHTIKQACI